MHDYLMLWRRWATRVYIQLHGGKGVPYAEGALISLLSAVEPVGG